MFTICIYVINTYKLWKIISYETRLFVCMCLRIFAEGAGFEPLINQGSITVLYSIEKSYNLFLGGDGRVSTGRSGPCTQAQCIGELYSRFEPDQTVHVEIVSSMAKVYRVPECFAHLQ